MARIRKSEASKTAPKQMIWKIGKYIRLSRDDGNIVSESVVNQDKILDDEIPGFFEDEWNNRPGTAGLSAYGPGYEVRTDQLYHC